MAFVKTIGIVLVAFSLYYFFILKDEFDLSNITYEFHDKSKWEVSAIPLQEKAQVDQILTQPFIYLSEGGQSYVFTSHDQKYVLKLFKFKRFKPHFLVQILPDIFPFKTYRDKHIQKRNRKLFTAFNGYKLAFDLHKQESGLLFVQLIPSNVPKFITIIDKKNRLKEINLERVSYILQEKGEMLSVDLSNILKKGELNLAKKRIAEVLNLYLSEYQKGIYDLDHGVIHNIGCIEGRIFHLDAGKFISDPHIKEPQVYRQDLIKIAHKLQVWLEKYHPQYSCELTDYLQKCLSGYL